MVSVRWLSLYTSSDLSCRQIIKDYMLIFRVFCLCSQTARERCKVNSQYVLHCVEANKLKLYIIISPTKNLHLVRQKKIYDVPTHTM